MPVSGSRLGHIGNMGAEVIDHTQAPGNAGEQHLQAQGGGAQQATGAGGGASALLLSHLGHGPVTHDTPPPSSAAPSPPPAPDSQAPQPGDKRPSGDMRGVDQIVNDNPTLKNLGNQSGVEDNLKKQVGDWTDPKLSPDDRADAAYRASEVLSFIKSSSAADGSKRPDSVAKDGKIEGFTKDGDARHGTEAGLLQDFGKQGYSALAGGNHSLPTTNDSHVNKDGTNESNAQNAGKGFLKFVHNAEDIASKVLGAIGDSKIPIISQIAALGSVTTEAIGQGANVGATAIEHGDVKQAGIDAGINVAAAGVSAVTAPGVGQALGKGAEAGAGAIAKDVAKQGAQGAGKEGASSAGNQIYDYLTS